MTQLAAHAPKLVKAEHVLAKIHGDHLYGRFNTWLALKVTRSVGSMTCAYIFALIALISLPAALGSGNVIVIVSWVAQTFLQLVLLSIIIVGQSVLQAASDARAEADHETITLLYKLNEQQMEILQALGAAKPKHKSPGG
jgi:hypothetical protein